MVYDGIGTMSKSKNNGVDPQALIDKYGADTARFYTMFASPPTSTLEWSDESVEGSFRFLKRVWSFALAHSKAHKTTPQFKEARHEVHSALRQANYDMQRHQFNTVASAAMKILNAIERLPDPGNATATEGLSILLRLLSPITPHLAHHLWRELGFGEDVLPAPLAGAGRGGARAGRDRVRGAGERQAARLAQAAQVGRPDRRSRAAPPARWRSTSPARR